MKLVPLPLSTGQLLWALVLQEFAQTPSHKVGLEGTAAQLLTALHQQMGSESIVLAPLGREW